MQPDLIQQAEMQFGERRNMLGLAMQKARVDLHLRCFLVWVFNVTDGGIHGELKKSHAELAQAPWGLCCSVSKVRSTIKRAAKLGFIIVTDGEYSTGGQASNGYAIDWPGVRSVLGFGLPMASQPSVQERGGGVLTEHPPVPTEHPPVPTEHPPVLSRQMPIKNSSLTFSFSGPASTAAVSISENPIRAMAAELQRAGVERSLPVAQELGQAGVTLQDISAAVAVMEFNKAKLSKPPGALVSFLRNGCWPAAVEQPPTESERAESERAQRIELAKKMRDDILFAKRSQPEAVRWRAVEENLPPELLALLDGERE